MTAEEIRKIVLEEIDAVAPGSGSEALSAHADMRDALDMDSMDMLNLMTALEQRLHVTLPEVDQPKLVTLDGAVAYIAHALSTLGQ